MARNSDFDPEGRRLPIKVDRTSNGEYVPLPLTKAQRRARQLAHDAATENARKLGLDRRAFLVSAAGAASTLLACNRAAHETGARGGRFAVPDEAARDQELAAATVTGDEFIFDVQTHCVDPAGRWLEGNAGERWRRTLTQVFAQGDKCSKDGFDCFSAQALAKEVFLDSDTDAAVVSALWGQPSPTPIDYAAESREIIAALGGEGARALIHGGVFPQEPGEIESMDEKAERHGVSAWKLYPQYGSNGRGIWLTDESALRMFDRARKLGVKTFAVHKGVSLPGLEPEYASPRDMGDAARAHPDLTFLVYHSAFESTVAEGPYDAQQPKGVDRLIKAHQDAGLSANEGNLYAELGSTWRHFMTRPTEAAHVLGKLLRYFGEERILWGTDAIWYGSPQDQIQAFRTFEISAELQERYGYPALTSQAKRKIFGLNAARVYGLDATALRRGKLPQRRAEYRRTPNPSFATFGPKTRREFLALWHARAGRPG
jgi:uncharacterized protein